MSAVDVTGIVVHPGHDHAIQEHEQLAFVIAKSDPQHLFDNPVRTAQLSADLACLYVVLICCAYMSCLYVCMYVGAHIRACSFFRATRPRATRAAAAAPLQLWTRHYVQRAPCQSEQVLGVGFRATLDIGCSQGLQAQSLSC